MSISAIVITKNEERNIHRCLQSLQFADEIIVIDSHSNDDTRRIAKDMGANVYTHDWHGYGNQKNIGLEYAKHNWALFIDADEEITPPLREAIQHTVQSPTYDFYWLRIVTVFLGKPLTHLYGHNPRLFKTDAGQWTKNHVHEQVETLDGEQIVLGDDISGIITQPLLHHSHPTIQSYLKKMHRYTTLDAKQMLKTNKHRSGKPVTPGPLLPWYLSAKQFLKLLLYRKGVFDGPKGWLWCALSGYYEYEMAVKYNNRSS